jgi:hypothetical protein
MSTPNTILEISQRNPIAKALVRAWREGIFTWEEMLFELASLLEKRCNDLVDENNMRSHILDNKQPDCPFPILEASLVPDLSNVKRPIARQTLLINAIVEIENIYQYLLKSVERKLKFVNMPDSMKFEILDKLSQYKIV